MRDVRFFTIPLLWFCVLTLVCVWILVLGQHEWTAQRPATCLPHHCFCEHVRAGNIRQPANTWSNMGFVLVGLLIFGVVARDRDEETLSPPSNPINNHRSIAYVYAVTVILMGLMSLYFHASLTFWGQWFDVQSIYLLGCFMLLYNLKRLMGWGVGLFLTGFVGANALLGYVQYAHPAVRRHMVGVVVLLALVLEFVYRKQGTSKIKLSWLGAAAGCIAMAFFVWILDIKKIWCWPHSLIQGHAIWHLLAACMTGCLFLYYRSEREEVES